MKKGLWCANYLHEIYYQTGTHKLKCYVFLNIVAWNLIMVCIINKHKSLYLLKTMLDIFENPALVMINIIYQLTMEWNEKINLN